MNTASNDMKTDWKSHLVGTPIGRMLDDGLTDIQIANILNVTFGAVNKWRNGNNRASTTCQSRAAGYYAGMDIRQSLATIQPSAQSSAPVISAPAPATEPAKEHVFIVSVPSEAKGRFLKMMALLALNTVDLDD